MPKVGVNDDNARFCVSRSTYYTTKVEAESAFLALRDVSRGKTIEFYEWSDNADDWKITDSAGYDEE